MDETERRDGVVVMAEHVAGARPPPPPAVAPTGRKLRPGVIWALVAGAVLLLVIVAGAVTAGVLLTRTTAPTGADAARPTDSITPAGPLALSLGVSLTVAENWSSFAEEDDYVLLASDELEDYARLDITVSAAPPATIEEALADDIQTWGVTGAEVAPAGEPQSWNGATFDLVLSVTFECPATNSACEEPLVGTYTVLFDTATGNRAFIVYDATNTTVLETHREEVDRMVDSLG